MTTATPSHTSSTSCQSRARCGLWLDALALCLLLALNWICYVRVINGYFLADDFLHVAYLKRVFDGDLMSLLRNFWGNWMGAQGTTFYRPLISLTLAFDYLLFGANASGFHLSNLFFQTACTLLIYFAARDIIQIFLARGAAAPEISQQARLGALATASLFAVSPLHCEVVAWIISRVDSVACMFYLASLSLFLLGRRLKDAARAKTCSVGSLVMFALALGSKEMAIVLPPTIFLLLLLSPADDKTSDFRGRFFKAFKVSLPFWLMLCSYMLLRTLALGTIAGGYQGSIGEGLSDSLAKRWLGDGSLGRVLFPLNLDVFGNGHSLAKTLRLLYIFAGVNFALALATAKEKMPALRALAFGLGWLVLTLLPTYQVWNLTETLQGSRFIYFGTMPLAFILATLIMPPLTAAKPALGRLFTTLRLILLTAFIIVLATITSKNNQPWVRAMKELKSFQTAICHLADQQTGKNILVLNIPQSYRGAHMLYNGATMSVMLTEPLAQRSIVDQIYTFEPATYGDADLLDASRLRRLMARPDNQNMLYLWDRNKFSLEPLDPNAVPTKMAPGDGIWPQGVTLTGGKIALSPVLNIPALKMDGLRIDLTEASKARLLALAGNGDNKPMPPSTAQPLLQLSYKDGKMTLPLVTSLQESRDGSLIFQLSEHKNWLKQGVVKELSLEALGLDAKSGPLEIAKISSLNLADALPNLQADGRDLVEGPDGICRVRGARPSFNYDVTNVPGAVGALCEVSRPDSWFEHYSGTLRDTKPSDRALHVIPFSRPRGRNILLSFAGIKDHGFYQIKIAAVDKDGTIIGYFSDPLNFQI